ncbi:MAG: hypothetical protein JKY31_02595 [Rhodobacteraceae bacterium]|nr:hypothetical protein [Paracoccaceae bacterium]
MQFSVIFVSNFKALAAVFVACIILVSCAAPPPPPKTGAPLHRALLDDTGYFLGETTASVGTGSCAVESRYGNKRAGPVSEMVCVNRRGGNSGRVKYRVNFTAPDAGHQIWKITATFPDKKANDLGIIVGLEEKFGLPRKVENPLVLTWQAKDAYLEVREDQYGAHIQLWDRSLRQQGGNN